MKLLRFIDVLAVIGYAGWLAWPFISPFLEGAGPDVAASRMGAEAEAGGDLFGFLPAWALWVGAVALYLVAALMLGSGNPKAEDEFGRRHHLSSREACVKMGTSRSFQLRINGEAANVDAQICRLCHRRNLACLTYAPMLVQLEAQNVRRFCFRNRPGVLQ